MQRHMRTERLVTKEQLSELYKNHSIKQISLILDIDKDTVSKLLVKYEIKQYKPNKNLQKINKEEFLSCFESGGFAAIKLKYKMHAITINKLLKYFGKSITTCYSLNEKFFDTDTIESFYLAGFIAADGCVYQPPKLNQPSVLSIRLATIDENHIQKIKNLLNYDGPIHRFEQKKDGKIWFGSGIQIGSTNICKSLTRFGINPVKSLTYEMPIWLTQHKLLPYFLLGYFDGDGCICFKQNNTCLIGIVGTYKFCEQFHNFIYENKPSKRKIKRNKKPKQKKNNKIYEINYDGFPITIGIYKLLNNNSTIFLERKFELFHKIEKFYVNNAPKKHTINLDLSILYKEYQEIKSYKKLSIKYNCSRSVIARRIKICKQLYDGVVMT